MKEDAPTNATGTAVPGTGDDDSTVVVKKKPKVYKRKRRMSAEQIEEAQRNYKKEYDNYHSKPEQREKNAARLRARRLMIKNGKAARGDGKDVHHKDNNPLNNDETNLKLTDPSWNRREPRLRTEGLGEGLKMNDPKLNKLFDKLKKGDTVTIEYTSAMSRGKDTFKVTAKNVVGKMRVEKITLKSVKNPRSVKHYLYKRDTGVTMAQGDMATSIESIKEEIKEIINIDERELSSTELKRREEIAQKIDDSEMKKKYGERWKSVKMAIATKVAKNESIFEEGDPNKEKLDRAKKKELKIARAIAQAQLEIAKAQERVQQLTKVQQKLKDSQKTEETMTEKYLKSKSGSLEDTILSVWKAGANVAQADTPTTPEVEEATDAEATAPQKVDGRTKQYKETLKRIAMRKERLNKLKSTVKEEDELEEGKFRPKDIKKAIKIAYDMEGNMTGAWKKIEKIKRGLGDEPTVQAALQDANEETIHEGLPAWARGGLYSVEFTFKSDRDAKSAVAFVKNFSTPISPGKLEIDISGKVVEFYRVGGDDKELKSVAAEVEQEFKGKIADIKVQNEDTIHEAVKGHFDAMDNKEMKKSLAKFRLKGKISQKDVNPGQDEWEVTGKSIEDIWAWYHKSGYGDKDDFEDMDDFKDTHFESREHHRNMMTEGDKEEYEKFFRAALKKFGAKSPAEMDDEKKKKFFDYVDKNWEGDHEEETQTKGKLPPALKKAIETARVKKKVNTEEDEDDDPVGDGCEESNESIRPTVKKSAVSDKDIEKFERGGGKVKKLKPGGRLKGMEKKRKDVIKGRMAREDYIHEGTWAIPSTQKEYDKVMKLMKRPIPAKGADKKYFNVIGDDEVWDDVEDILKKEGPKGDIRPAFKKFFDDPRIKKFMKDKGIKEEVFESMDIIRKIAANKESAEIDGHKVDVYSASAMCKVFDNLSHANQQKVEQMLKSKKGINTFAEFSIANI